MAQGGFVAYFRVSTQQQGRSGLGLEAQRKAVADYLNGGAWELVAEFTEVESGKRNDRPELAKALEAAKRQKATLIIAKLDRLARNARFLLGVVESSVDAVFCDLPTVPAGPVGKFLMTQMAAVAELEAGLISQRTKAALQAAKARGKALGWAIEARKVEQLQAAQHGAAVMRDTADRHAANLLPVIQSIRGAGITTLAEIAQALNARGIQTARGGAWHPTTVRNILRRENEAAFLMAKAGLEDTEKTVPADHGHPATRQNVTVPAVPKVHPGNVG